MKEFETKTCAMCGVEVDETVESVEEDVPGATIEKRFCSERHRRDYRDRAQRDDRDSARERVEEQLRDAGMNPDAFENKQNEPTNGN